MKITFPPLAQIIKNRWDIFKASPNLKDILQKSGIHIVDQIAPEK